MMLLLYGTEGLCQELGIIKYCKGLGYDADAVKSLLSSYDGVIKKETTGEVVKWLFSKM